MNIFIERAEIPIVEHRYTIKKSELKTIKRCKSGTILTDSLGAKFKVISVQKKQRNGLVFVKVRSHQIA